MASRCFPTLNRDIDYSGEYTRAKKQSTIYKSLRSAILSNDTLDKTQKYETKYKICKDCELLCGNKGQVVSANSHEALLDITKGKYYTNPLLIGASAAKYESWAGGFILSDVSGIASIQDLSWNTTNTTLVKGLNNNTFQFPPLSQPDTKDWNTHAYPGFIIDPNNTIFWQSCNENKTKLIAPISNTGKIDYKWTNGYWKAVSGQPLQGMSFPQRVILTKQETNLDTENARRFAPMPKPNVNNDEEKQLRVWCKGKFALK